MNFRHQRTLLICWIVVAVTAQINARIVLDDPLGTSGDTLSICVGDTSGMYGSCVCVPVTTDCFQDMLSFQFTMNWDPIDMNWCVLTAVHPIFSVGGLDVEYFLEQGLMSVTWQEPTSTPQTLAPGDTLFMLCLRPNTTPGSVETISITNDVVEPQATSNTNTLEVNTKDGSIEVLAPDSMALFYNACPVGNSLNFEFEIHGGMGPYTYFINQQPGGATLATGSATEGSVESAGSIPPDTYQIIIVDSNGDSLVQLLPFGNVSQQFFFPVVTILDELCPGGQNGALILFDVIGGSGTYQTTWIGADTIVYNKDTLGSLAAGMYTLALRDSITGCVDSTVMTVLTDTLEISLIDAQPPGCSGMTDGQITISTNQQGQFLYTWLDSNAVQFNQYVDGPNTSLVGLAANDYTIIVTNGGCADTLQVPLPEVAGMYLELDTIQHNLCFGDRNGRITVNIFSSADSLGFDPDLVTWSPFPNGATIQDFGKEASILFVPAGIYTVEATDSFGCTISEIFEVTEPPELVVNLADLVPPMCPDLTGSLDLSNLDHGGTPPYQFTWQWINADTTNGATEMISDLALGDSLSIYLVDANGCLDTAVLSFPSGPSIDILVLEPISCSGSGLGTLQVTGAVGGSTILWSTGSMADVVTGLAAGVYSVTVTDGMGCMDSAAIVLSGDDGIAIVTDSLRGVNCNGGRDGYVEITTVLAADSSEIIPFSVVWDPQPAGVTITNNGAQSQISGLPAGSYSVTVEDTTGCSVAIIFVITEPAPLQINIDSLIPPACPNTTGILDMTQVDHGGIGPYDFVWELFKNDTVTFGFTGIVPGLRPGDSVTVFLTDANGCQDTTILSFNDGPDIEVVLDNPVLCPGGNEGILSVTGEIAGTTIQWSTGDTVATITGLTPGNYTVTVTDSGGCSSERTIDLADTTINVTVFSPMEFMALSTCNEPDSGVLFNELLDYPGMTEYIWHTLDDTVTSVPGIIVSSSGTYVYSVRDVNTGCIIYSGSIAATFDDGITLQSNTMDAICAGDTNGTLSVQAAGGSGSYNFDWETLPDAGPLGADFRDSLAAGIYQVTVTDANNASCSAIATVEIFAPEALAIEIPVIDAPACAEGQALVTIGSVTGGTGPYQFSIDGGPAQAIGTPIPLVAGSYHIEVRDAAGCSRDTLVQFESQAGFAVDVGPDLTIDLGDSIRINGTLMPPVPVDTLIWNPPAFLNCTNCLTPWAKPFASELFTLTVVDTNGCIATDEVLITVLEKQETGIYIPNAFSPNGDGINDVFHVYFGPAYAGIDQFAIYNRWGGVLHSGINRGVIPTPTLIWDGTSNGEVMQPGVYVYHISVTLLNGQQAQFSGDITIVR